MSERDYSRFVTDITPKEDNRPFWLRLLLSIRPSFKFTTKKIPSSGKDAIDKVKLNITGGASF